MVRGTRLLIGYDASQLLKAIQVLQGVVEAYGFQPVIVSSLAEYDMFAGQIGDNRVFELDSKLSGRKEILLPEVTGVLRKSYRDNWSKLLPKPVKLWYCQRCYRYDRPQRGRWREFWQFGIEHMPSGDVKPLLRECLDALGLQDYEWRDSVPRGQAYYTNPGFEVWKNNLQIAGGGPYAEGSGWAIGLDRALLVKSVQNP